MKPLPGSNAGVILKPFNPTIAGGSMKPKLWNLSTGQENTLSTHPIAEGSMKLGTCRITLYLSF